MLRQYINGKWVNSIYADGDTDAIKSLLEGEIEEWDKKAETGKDAALPVKLNPIKMSCGNKNELLSCSFTLRHIEPAKNADDVKPLVIGKFSASWKSDVKCDYARLIGNGSK